MYLADVKFKRHKVVYNQPSELWPNNSFLNQMSQANSIKIQTQKTTSFLQKKRDGFVGEHVVKSDFKGKNISRLLHQSTWPTYQKGGYVYRVDNPYPLNKYQENQLRYYLQLEGIAPCKAISLTSLTTGACQQQIFVAILAKTC